MALRGLAALLFGLLTFFWPGITLIVMIFLFGGYALADGIFAIAASIKPRESKPEN